MSGLSDLLANGPQQGPGKRKGPKPLGVPDDYTVAPRTSDAQRVAEGLGGASNSWSAPMPPRFYAGDEYAPASLSPERIADVQSALATAGLYGPKARYRIGVWDDATLKAYRSLLEFANRSGMDEREALEAYASGVEFDEEEAEGGSERAPLVVRQENPDDIADVVRTAAQAKLGRRLDDATVARIVKSFQDEDARAQLDSYQAAITGGTVYDAPDPSVFAEQAVTAENPALAAAHFEAGIVRQALDGLERIASGADQYGV